MEARYVRVCRLHAMDDGELRRLLTGDPAEAALWIASAAHYGEAEAQLRLGRMWLEGIGVRQADAGLALRWFNRAAGQGLAEAMNMVGRCHENGWGAPADEREAAVWYKRAAAAGSDWGQYNYAHMLFDGRGVQQDMGEALVWYARAASQGHARAMNLLARCYEEGWGADRDQVSAAVWYRRSAEAGYFRGQFNFATLLAGWGLIEEAAAWFDTALSAAPLKDRPALIEVLRRHPDPRLTLAIQGGEPASVENRPAP
jgi:TPR repeat protein